ncbi:MAG: hypothetical protein QOF99_5829, partial [Pseudonocardiales bacterium]|nr:hypothetical protein [Pseudonocardiales bacterium]
GSSLAAVKLAIELNRAVSLKDITGHPILADLAGLLDSVRRVEDRRQPPTGPARPRAQPDSAPAAAPAVPHAADLLISS